MLQVPGLIFCVAAVLVAVTVGRLRWPLPLGLISAAILAALLSGYWIPFRHLVEGGFGYMNLVLGLFAGAFFGQAMRASGASEAVALSVEKILLGRTWLILCFSAVILFLVGMFVGIAGIAVLATGVFVVPQLRRLGLQGHEIGAFIAVIATCGMIAPPLNVPAMTISDGVNMPYAGFVLPLLVLSVPPAAVMLIMTGLAARGRSRAAPAEADRGAAVTGFVALGLVLGFWALLRAFPSAIPDPAAPVILVAGGLVALPRMLGARLGEVIKSTFVGVPLILAAVLVTVGIAVQIMTLTGIRGWAVINTMAIPEPWTYLGLVLLPLFGGVLTSMGTSNVLGVPFAFALIGQDMILNSAALSAISALSEFVPPTSIAAALSVYIVGDTTLGRVLRASLIPVLVIAALAVLMLIFADSLAGPLSTSGIGPRDH